MPAVILDSCGTINLYATGRFVPILTAMPHKWHLPAAVNREVRYYRQPDAEDPEALVKTAIDLAPAVAASVLTICECAGDDELARYVELAARIGDDGEAMGLAIAKCRGWTVLTDDRKARRIATELGVAVLSTPQVIQAWSAAAAVAQDEVAQVIRAIQRFGNFVPKRNLPDADWWFSIVEAG